MTDEKEKKLLKDTIGDINVIDFALSGVCILFISVLLTMGNPKGSLEFALWSFSFAVGCFAIGIRLLYQQKNGLGKGNKRLTYGSIILCNLGEVGTGIGILFVLHHIDHWTWLFVSLPLIFLAPFIVLGKKREQPSSAQGQPVANHPPDAHQTPQHLPTTK